MKDLVLNAESAKWKTINATFAAAPFVPNATGYETERRKTLNLAGVLTQTRLSSM
ncbi:hypothetical protein HY628_02595 [Candidatus Uhrbacteria bacterium]|nr:hypothetical protein [Candidatus Uhrbacteria bacterium]